MAFLCFSHCLLRRRTRFTEVGDLINSIPEKISTKYTVFWRLWKNRKWWGGAISRDKFSALGPIQQYMCHSDRTSGLGWASTTLFLRRRLGSPKFGTLLILYPRKFPRNTRFLADCAKTGSDGAEQYQLTSLVPAGLNNGTWVRAIGLPVWAGHRRPCWGAS